MQPQVSLHARPTQHRKPHVVYAATSTALVPVSRQSKTAISRRGRKDNRALEQQVLDALASVKGRGKSGLSEEQQALLQEAVALLEQDGGVENPTDVSELNGRWKLLYTSSPGTASPIQNTFTGIESFSIYQEVSLQGDDPRVNNGVTFGTWGELKVEAQASTENKPLPGFTPRVDDGEFLFGLFGKSFIYQPARPNTRIDFQFVKAAFSFSFLPFKVPYPVPFRLLGNERKGFLDVVYMNEDGTFRLSRGNKGTLFILVKDVPIKNLLRKAIREGDDQKVLSLVELMSADEGSIPKPARSPKVAGTWRLVWSQQSETASALQKFGSKQANSFQIIDAGTGTLQNLVDLGFVRIQAKADCSAASDTRTSVDVNDACISLGEGVLPAALKIPLPLPSNQSNPGFVDWLYLDDEIRITKGSKGSLFIHYRE